MSDKAIRPVTLMRIVLEYDNGTKIVVPENKKLEVGTAFMKLIKEEQLEWQVIKQRKRKGVIEQVLGYFKL